MIKNAAMPGRPWKPLLHGEDADVVELELEQIRRETASSEPRDGSLIFGETALLLFRVFDDLAHRRSLENIPNMAQRLDQLLAEELLAVGLSPPGLKASRTGPEILSLLYGPCGPGWLLSHLTPVGSHHEETLHLLDEAVLSAVRSRPITEWDFIYGLSGTAVYLGARHRRSAAAKAALEHLVDELGLQAEKTRAGVAWRTRTHEHTRLTQDQAPDGFFDVGVAHGTPGPLWALATAAARGIRTDAAQSLVQDGLRWMAGVAGRGDGGSVFPDLVTPGEPKSRRPCRLGWCYGDAGILALLTAVAGPLPHPKTNEPASVSPAQMGSSFWIDAKWLRIAATRSLEDSGVVDAGLCHGAAGIGHLFNRIYQRTGDELCREAAKRWIMTAVAFRQEYPDSGGHSRLQVRPQGFLAGSSGVGLAFLAAVSSAPPYWDALLGAHPPTDPIPDLQSLVP